MDNILVSSEVDFYVETMQAQNIKNIGNQQWLEWHQRLQKLNQQALIEAAAVREEYVKETLVSCGKVPILIHEAILINIWKYKVLPQLLKLESNPLNTFLAYSVLYHEAVAVALLELVMYHTSCYDTLDDTAADLLDYACGVASQLLSIKQAETNENETPKEELFRQRDNLAFDIGIRALSIIRYLGDNLDRLPLSLCSRIYATHDVPVLFAQILLTKPWIKDRKQYSKGKWMDWDGEVLGQAEAQVWLTLRQLLLDQACSTHYSLTQSRRSQLTKTLMLLTPTILDQLSPLIELKVWLSRLSVGQEPPPSTPKPFLIETVLEIKDKIINQCGGKWRKIAQDQLPLIFCNDQNILMENARVLCEAYNTDLLEQMETKDKANCEECGKSAIQRCSHCKKTWYCSRSCQVTHWPQHKSQCVQ